MASKDQAHEIFLGISRTLKYDTGRLICLQKHECFFPHLRQGYYAEKCPSEVRSSSPPYLPIQDVVPEKIAVQFGGSMRRGEKALQGWLVCKTWNCVIVFEDSEDGGWPLQKYSKWSCRMEMEDELQQKCLRLKDYLLARRYNWSFKKGSMNLHAMCFWQKMSHLLQ